MPTLECPPELDALPETPSAEDRCHALAAMLLTDLEKLDRYDLEEVRARAAELLAAEPAPARSPEEISWF